MTVEIRTDLNLPDLGNVCDADRPVLSYSWDAKGPHPAAAHRHARGHIMYTESGAYWVITPEGTWLVPAGLAIWIPPRIQHEVYSHGSVSARILFIDEAYAEPLPSRCGTVIVSSLFTELLLRTIDYGNDYTADGPAARLAQVMLDELAVLEFAPLLLPVSKDPRLARVMRTLVEEPDARQTIEQLAREAAASSRTLARLFRHQMGMTFTQWRTNLLLMKSIERLAQGASVTEVAMELGFSSASSFVFKFRTQLGVSPGRYRRLDTAKGR
jgi:AraC-like DNA-binding protein